MRTQIRTAMRHQNIYKLLSIHLPKKICEKRKRWRNENFIVWSKWEKLSRARSANKTTHNTDNDVHIIQHSTNTMDNHFKLMKLVFFTGFFLRQYTFAMSDIKQLHILGKADKTSWQTLICAQNTPLANVQNENYYSFFFYWAVH